ncbi:MBL fold metallo-hydrolase [Mesoterricola silvestris]|uniref:MBL fold metallo-hydrolase n=1 Tax=Mesoterricola silvestris TaxID=2927979 RepID=A0AA48GZY3_9BACT|nr:MBL fold metallo-hydrolase [Mesoterricola silvestris]BDU74941.1 MBL fold metallo-hydrolase [Mesoterricola silvestris]
MRYASLASGSKGNCHAFSRGSETLLVDAGISLKQIRLRLAELGWDPGQVRAVAITHEHSDHIAAIPVLLRNTDWDLLATPETLARIQAIQGIEIPRSRWIPLRAGEAVPWNGMTVLPFTTPHDAADSVAYRIEAGGFHAAVVTDLGHPTALVEDHCRDLDLLVLEANHDVQMLREGGYPAVLKARILSRVGHLSNESMGELLGRVLSGRLRNVVLAHLSEQNNDPELARFAAEGILRGTATALHVACQASALLVADPEN